MPTIAPAIIQWTPANNSTDVALNPVIYATFNTDMAVVSINTNNIVLKDSSSNPVQIAVRYHALTRVAEIRTLTQLTQHSTYSLTVIGDGMIVGTEVDGVTDILGTPMIGSSTMSFTTGETIGTPYTPGGTTQPEPTEPATDEPIDIDTVVPGLQASNISAGKIEIYFNRNVDPTTISNANIYVIKRVNL